MSSHLYLFLFLLLFFFIVFFLRSFLLWKNTGLNPMTFDDADNAHNFNGKLFKIIFLLELAVVLTYSFGGQWYNYLLPFWYLEYHNLRLIGWLLLHISLLWIFIAQLQMKDSWRIGIDSSHKTELINHGLFSISRNPIFFGILIADLGLFFVIPNAFTLLIGALSYATIQTQVRLEEEFLHAQHGRDYVEYCRKVRRWI